MEVAFKVVSVELCFPAPGTGWVVGEEEEEEIVWELLDRCVARSIGFGPGSRVDNCSEVGYALEGEFGRESSIWINSTILKKPQVLKSEFRLEMVEKEGIGWRRMSKRVKIDLVISFVRNLG